MGEYDTEQTSITTSRHQGMPIVFGFDLSIVLDVVTVLACARDVSRQDWAMVSRRLVVSLEGLETLILYD